MQNRNVLHIISELNPYGGSIKILEAWAKLSRHSHMFCIYSRHPRMTYQDDFSLKTVKASGNLIEQSAASTGHAREHGAHVVIGHYFRGSILAYIVSTRTGIPFVAYLHAPANLFSPLKRLIYKLALWLADAVIYNSKYTASTYGMTGNHRLIYNCIDELKPETKSGLCFNNEHIEMLCIGGLVKWKNYEIVIRALCFLDKKFRLSIIGDGPERAKLQETVRELKLQERVRFLGYIDNAHEHYHRYDLFLHPSTNESFGIVVLEALLSRTPVIVSERCATVEIIDNGRYGWIAKHDDAQEWASQINAIVSNPEKTWDKCVNGREWALERFASAGFANALDVLVADTSANEMRRP